MDQNTLLLEYLKEHYTQARQHETRQTSSTTFLTATSAVIISLAFKDGHTCNTFWQLGLLLFFIGGINWWIIRAHFIGNRFHTSVAGETRRALEKSIQSWTVDNTSIIRERVIAIFNLKGPKAGIGKSIYEALRLVPIFFMLLGVVFVVLGICGWTSCKM